MQLKERRYSVLTVSSQPKFNQALGELIGSRQYESELETSVSGAKRRLLERSFDILIINVPLPDDDGISLAIDRSEGMGCAVLLLVKSEYYPTVFDRVCPHGVYTLPKPSPKQMVAQAFDWLESTRERLRRLEKKLAGKSNYELVNTDQLVMTAGTYKYPEEAGSPFDEVSRDYKGEGQ